MALPFLIAVLGKEIGLPLAKNVVTRLTSTKPGLSKVEKATAMINSGSSALEAFQKTFGNVDFDKALTAAIEPGSNGWTYEAGQQEYVRLQKNSGKQKAPASLLREELNLNLDRVIRVYGNKKSDVDNYFLGLLRQWQNRYVELIGEDDDSRQTFQTIESLLDGHRKTFAEVFRMLQKTGLGMAGAALVIQAALIATSTGVGIIAWLTTWWVGIPLLQVAGLAVAGGLLFGLSRMDFSPSNAKSATIAVAYKLLDRHAASPGSE